MNFRFALCLAVAMILSIIFASCLFVSQKLKLGLVLMIVGVFLVFVLCFAFFKKRFLAVVAVVVLIVAIPAISICLKAKRLDENRNLIAETNTVSGKIYKISENSEKNRIYLYLDNVKILNDDEANDFYGNLFVIVFADGVDTSRLQVGRYLTLENSEISCFTLNEGTSSRDRSYISNGVTASSFVFSYNIKFEDKVSLKIRDKIKNKVYKSFENTDTFFTNIGYAMIFGETSVLEDEVHKVFQDAGIAHLLAVSGFHISIIVAFLNFILDKLKTNKHLKIFIVGILLFGYAYLCSFAVSVIRASIMALLYLYASNRHKEYDKLSSLSIACVLILLVEPMKLFNISFVFSFVSILSIILLMPVFEFHLSKILCDKLSSSLSLSLSVSIGIALFQLGSFGEFPVLSFFTNLLTVPLVGMLFIFLIISILLGPFLHLTEFLIRCFGFCMKYIVQFNHWVANNGIVLISENVNVLVLCSWIVLMFIVSDYLFAGKKIKLSISGVLISLLIALMI